MAYYQQGTNVYQENPTGGYYPIASAPAGTYQALPQYGYSAAPSSGQVQGATTGGSTPSYSEPAPTGDTGGGGEPDAYSQWLDQQYGAMFSNLDEMESGLTPQRQTQEQIATNTAQMTGNTLTGTYGTNRATLESNQAKNLDDLSQYLQSAWQQGNVMLGTRGASDSSAANQYSYALAKQGTRQRGDIMQETQRLQTNLKTAFDTEMKNNELDKNNKMLQIAQWFMDAQNQVRGLRAELQAQKSEQILNYALQMVGQAQQVWASNKSTLDQWAANKATNLGQLTQMLQKNTANMPTFQGLNKNIYGGGGGSNFWGFGNVNNQEKNRLA